MEESRSRAGVSVIGSATSFPTRAADSVSDSVRHSWSSFRCLIRSVSTCPPRGNLVDGLPRAPSMVSYSVGDCRVVIIEDCQD